MRLLLEDLRRLAVTFLDRFFGRPAALHGLRELAVAEPDVAQHRLLEILAGMEATALMDVLDAAVDPLEHGVRAELHWRGRTMLDPEVGAGDGRARGAALPHHPTGHCQGQRPVVSLTPQDLDCTGYCRQSSAGWKDVQPLIAETFDMAHDARVAGGNDRVYLAPGSLARRERKCDPVRLVGALSAASKS